MRSAVALAVPDGASRFVSGCSSTISARGNDAGRLLGEPHHQDRAEREVGRVEARHAGSPARAASTASSVESRRPDHDGHACGQTRLDVRDARHPGA